MDLQLILQKNLRGTFNIYSAIKIKKEYHIEMKGFLTFFYENLTVRSSADS